MDIEDLKKSGLIFYETIVGSRAYGLHNENSDIDVKGFYWVPPEAYLGLNPPVTQKDGHISDDKNDNTYYSLYKAFELLKTANPNMIELLWMPADVIQLRHSEIMDILLENRRLFITKQAYCSHAEYARNQIKKARGKNKKVHNPEPETMPVKEDFCRVILLNNLDLQYMQEDNMAAEDYEKYPSEENGWTVNGLYPFRPVPLKETDIDLSQYHVASLEHVPNAFRLYDYSLGNPKGVFRGNDTLVPESIPKEDEWGNIVGLLIYDKSEYDKAVKDWHSYWDWKKNRNIHRWTSQENKEIDYDVKNMQHCFRLLYSGLNILTDGEPIVRCEGELLRFLKDIRNEKFTYDKLMERLSVLEKKTEDAFKRCNLPENYDHEKLDKLYRQIMEAGRKVY